MEKYEKISQVCEHMGMSLIEAWPYLAGQQCRKASLAERMGEALGIKPETIILGKSRKRLRSGVLVLFANEAATDRFHLCEILNGGRRPSLDLAQRLEAVSGVPADAWVSPDEHYNPILAYIQKQRRSLGGRRTRKPTRPIRLAPNRTATPANAAGNDA